MACMLLPFLCFQFLINTATSETMERLSMHSLHCMHAASQLSYLYMYSVHLLMTLIPLNKHEIGMPLSSRSWPYTPTFCDESMQYAWICQFTSCRSIYIEISNNALFKFYWRPTGAQSNEKSWMEFKRMEVRLCMYNDELLAFVRQCK